MDNPFINPSILSICPGLRGLEKGLERAIGKTSVVAYVEIEAFIITNLLAEMQGNLLDAAPIWSDIKTFNPKPFRKKIHGLTAGYPCQPFSLAGKMEGIEDHRHLWPHILRSCEATGPLFLWCENVSNHFNMGFDQVYQDLSGLGYAVEAGFFTAEEVGAPHERERIFILAIDKSYMAQLGDAGSLPGKLAERQQGQGRKATQRKSSPVNTGQVSDTISGASSAGSKRGGRKKGADTHRSGKESKMANASSSGSRRQHIGRIQPQTIGSRQLAYSYRPGFPQFWNHAVEVIQRYNRARNTSTTTDTNGANVEGRIEHQDQARGTRFSNAYGAWPAGFGQPQYPWESPRTIEPGVGVRINGYNFREDLLRAIGNSVVEQQAEIAFIDLLQKHMRNVEIQMHNLLL